MVQRFSRVFGRLLQVHHSLTARHHAFPIVWRISCIPVALADPTRGAVIEVLLAVMSAVGRCLASATSEVGAMGAPSFAVAQRVTRAASCRGCERSQSKRHPSSCRPA